MHLDWNRQTAGSEVDDSSDSDVLTVVLVSDTDPGNRPTKELTLLLDSGVRIGFDDSGKDSNNHRLGFWYPMTSLRSWRLLTLMHLIDSLETDSLSDVGRDLSFTVVSDTDSETDLPRKLTFLRTLISDTDSEDDSPVMIELFLTLTRSVSDTDWISAFLIADWVWYRFLEVDSLGVVLTFFWLEVLLIGFLTQTLKDHWSEVDVLHLWCTTDWAGWFLKLGLTQGSWRFFWFLKLMDSDSEDDLTHEIDFPLWCTHLSIPKWPWKRWGGLFWKEIDSSSDCW